MNHNTYLFFDCECANCFDGEGKICSLGYVLTDDDFNIIEKDDVLINPKCEFDWYILNPKNPCHLAYSKDEFRAHPDFESYYKDIKKLFTSGNRKIFGFSVDGDVSFINTACERAGVNYIQFSALDLQPVLNEVYQNKMKLSLWCQYLHIDTSSYTAHRSVDDAEMTMLCCKAMCKKLGITGDELYEKFHGNLIGWEYMLDVMEERRIKRELKAKIDKLINKKNAFAKNKPFFGKQFELDRGIYHDLEDAYEVVKTLYDEGGVVSQHISGKGYFVIKDAISEKVREKYEKRGIEVVTLDKVKEMLGK